MQQKAFRPSACSAPYLLFPSRP